MFSLGRFASIFFVFSFVFVLCLSAQDLDDVTVSGRITDSNKLPIVGATVTVVSVATGEERVLVTDVDGRYKFLKLKPGAYKVKAAAKGFGAKETPEITTIAAQNVQRDFSLAPGDVSAETTVTVADDDAPMVDTTRTIVGGTITEREIQEIPNSTRNPLDLVLTLGGTSEEQLSTSGLAEDRGLRNLSVPGTTPEEAGIFGLSGGAAYSNNLTIDGLDNNDDRGASFRFQPSLEAVSEVQVVTNQFSSEYGRASGGRVNLRTRSGSNRYQGRAFYFFRNDALNANTWNNNRNGIPIPPLTEHNPGGTFGGPIIRNKLFFFAAYEYDDIADSTVLDAWVPLNFSNPHFELPAPTDPNQTFNVTQGGVGTVTVARYILPTDTPAVKHLFTSRVDWTATKNSNFTFSYQLGRSNDLRSFSGTNRIADSLIGRIRNTDAFNGQHNYVISDKVVNQLRFQYSTLRPLAAQDAGPLSPALLITFTGPTGQGGTQVFGSTTDSSDRAEDRWQFQDTVNYIAGNHTFRFGFDYQSIDAKYTDRFDATGTYRFSNFVFFSINSVSSYQHNFDTTSKLHNDYYGFFMQDDWRVRRNFSLSYGLRYEGESILDDKDNWGPRVAFAWNPFPKEEKTVVRFGAGIFYNRVLLRTVDDYTGDLSALRFDSGSLNVPAGVTVVAATVRDFLSTQFPNPLTLDTVIPVNATNSYPVRQLARRSSVFRSLSPDLVVPESYQFNAGFEREVRRGLVFEVNVTYNKAVHLWRESTPNAPILPPGTPDRNNDGQSTLTDYLLGVTTGPNRFYEGSYSDTVGVHVSNSDAAAACTTASNPCWVNVNSSNTYRTPGSTSTTTCSTTSITNSPGCRAFSIFNNATFRPLFNEVGVAQVEVVSPVGNSEYLGAIFELRTRYKRFKNGFGGSMRAVYTLSKLMDDGIVNTSDATLPFDFAREWSRSLSDRRHRVAISGTFDMPKWFGGLRFSPLLRLGSSAPFNLSAGGIDRNLDDVSNDRPNFTGNVDDIQWRVFQSQPFPQALANQFALAPIGSPGNLPRNAGHGPKQFLFDLSVSREFKFGERYRLRPVAEFNNILNANVYSFGSNFINFEDLGTASAQDGFLAPTRTIYPRRIRLGIRFDF